MKEQITSVLVLALTMGIVDGLHAQEDGQACPPFDGSTNSPPAYPQAAKEAKLGGLVVVLLETDPCGKVIAATVEQSSKRRDLDEAAVLAAKQWQFRTWGSKGAEKLRVPVEFIPDELSTERDMAVNEATRKALGQWRSSRVPEIAPVVDGKVPGYPPDPLAMSRPTIAENLAVLEREGKQIQGITEGVRSYALDASYGKTTWEYFDESWLFSPALIRYRLVSDGKKGYWAISTLCEARKEDCAKFKEFIDGLPPQPALPPPPAPPKDLLERF